MKGLNRMLFLVFFAIGIITGWSTITNNSVSASPMTPPTVYLEKPSIPLCVNPNQAKDQFAINIDLVNKMATIEGDAKNVNVNVTTAVKTVIKYKYKTIKEIEYVPVYIQKLNAPVKPKIDNYILPGHISI